MGDPPKFVCRRYGRTLMMGRFIGRLPLRFWLHGWISAFPVHPALGLSWCTNDEEEVSLRIGLVILDIELTAERLRPYPEPSEALLAWADTEREERT